MFRLLQKISVSIFSLFILFGLQQSFATTPPAGIVVLQTDFGVKDGAVSAVKGVMYSVSTALVISDVSNEIPPFNIWEGAYRLYQVVSYWPRGTVFVSVIDPGVGTKRRSIVAESNNGYYFVTPDNGTLTLIADTFGLKEVREIDESKNRLPGSGASYTFHGRDVYGYTGARLAAGKIDFSEVGPVTEEPITKISYEKAYIKNNKLYGTVAIIDPAYGNLWTNIPTSLVDEFKMKKGQTYRVSIFHRGAKQYAGTMAFHNTFGGVAKGKPLLYLNSLMNLSIGMNQLNFSKQKHISAGADWKIEIESI